MVTEFNSFRLHAVTGDEIIQRDDFFEKAEAIAATGKVALHLRGHGLCGSTLLETAVKLRDITAGHRVPLIINDRLDIALAVKADAVHLGERSIPLSEAGHLCRERGLGLGFSCHDLTQVNLARSVGCHYIYLGTIFNSASKPGIDPIGVEALRLLVPAAGCPCFAIGGIDKDNIQKVIDAGANGAAAISAFWKVEDPAREIKELADNLNRS